MPRSSVLALLLPLLVACGEKFTAAETGGSGGASAAGGSGGAPGGGGSASGGVGGGAGSVATGGAPATCHGLKFDGVNDLVSVLDDPALDGIAPMTVEAWIRAEAYPGEVQILSHHNHNTHTGYVLLVFDNSTAQFRYQFDGSNHPVGGAVVSAQKWHHIAATYDSASGLVQLFVDGALGASDTIPKGKASDDADPLVIGRAAYEDNFAFQGVIDEVRISKSVRYTGAFTPSKTPFVVDGQTVALWHFEEPGGQLVNDETGKHDGALGKDTSLADDDPARVEIPCLDQLVLGG
ncbi:MAG: LamG domain-containing protein [Polyangiaceae bacterium]